MTEIYLHFLFAHYGLYGNAPVPVLLAVLLPPAPCPVQPDLCGGLGPPAGVEPLNGFVAARFVFAGLAGLASARAARASMSNIARSRFNASSLERWRASSTRSLWS